MDTKYVEDRRIEFIELKQEDETVMEYEAKFLIVNHYAQCMVSTKQDKCVRYENGLRFDLKIQVTPHQEQVFETLLEKTKIVEIKLVEHKKVRKVRAWLKDTRVPMGRTSFLKMNQREQTVARGCCN